MHYVCRMHYAQCKHKLMSGCILFFWIVWSYGICMRHSMKMLSLDHHSRADPSSFVIQAKHKNSHENVCENDEQKRTKYKWNSCFEMSQIETLCIVKMEMKRSSSCRDTHISFKCIHLILSNSFHMKNTIILWNAFLCNGGKYADTFLVWSFELYSSNTSHVRYVEYERITTEHINDEGIKCVQCTMAICHSIPKTVKPKMQINDIVFSWPRLIIIICCRLICIFIKLPL